MAATCQLPGCGRTQENHGELMHQFSPTTETLSRRIVVPSSMSVGPDPVLRVLLAKKGIITAEELEATERELKAAGLLGGFGAGYGPRGGSDRKVRDNPQA